MIRSIITNLLVAGALACTGPVLATTFCATTSAELQAALTIAESNDENDSVRIATGFYAAPLGGFIYDEVGSEDQHLTLSGGWTAFFDNPCGQQSTRDPFMTVLDGGDAEQVLDIKIYSDSNLDISLLMFVNGNALPEGTAAFGRGGGLRVRTTGNYAGRIIVESNIFLSNAADYGGGLYLVENAVDDGRMYVVNNAFIANHSRASNGPGAADLRLVDGHIYVTNNTAAFNTTDGTSTGGIRIQDGLALVANNNLWGNDRADLNLYTGADVDLRNNNIGRLSGDPLTESGTIDVEPEYEDGFFNFTPIYYSPLVNAGSEPPEPPINWYLTDADLRGNLRLVGPHVDIGAYESQEVELIFVNGFEPDEPPPTLSD